MCLSSASFPNTLISNFFFYVIIYSPSCCFKPKFLIFDSWWPWFLLCWKHINNDLAFKFHRRKKNILILNDIRVNKCWHFFVRTLLLIQYIAVSQVCYFHFLSRKVDLAPFPNSPFKAHGVYNELLILFCGTVDWTAHYKYPVHRENWFGRGEVGQRLELCTAGEMSSTVGGVIPSCSYWPPCRKNNHNMVMLVICIEDWCVGLPTRFLNQQDFSTSFTSHVRKLEQHHNNQHGNSYWF